MKKTCWNRDWSIRPILPILAALGGGKPQPEPVHLPHDAMIGEGRKAENPTRGGCAFFDAKNYDYIKTFTLSQEDRGKLVWLELEGAYGNATVWVNGDFVGECPYGYGDFAFQISDYFRFGQENEVKVTIKNTSQGNSRWYSGAGLFRDVQWIWADSPLHIALDGVRITTLSAGEDLAVLEVETRVQQEGVGLREGQLVTQIYDGEDHLVGEDVTRYTLGSGSQASLRQRIELTNPRLWHPDTPNLYTCRSLLLGEEGEVDREETVFGVRTLSLDSVHGLRINGKTLKLKGGCIHHDNGVLGAATFADAELRRARLMKEAGYNALRSAHHPMGKAMLRACDQLGLVVMDEFTDVWTKSKCDYDYSIHFPHWWEQHVEAMVNKDYNHPCVVMYSTGNEIPEFGSRIGSSWGKKIGDKIRSLDKTRYLTNGINVMFAVMDRIGEIASLLGQEGVEAGEINEMMTNRRKLMDQINNSDVADRFLEESCSGLDIVGYNYAAQRYEREHEKYPYRVFVGSETAPSALDVNWELVEKHGYVIGDFTWTAWEYLGEVGIGRVQYGDRGSFYGEFPWISSLCADFDLIGCRRPVSYWRETIWGGRGHTPYLSVRNPAHYGEEPLYDMWSWSDSISSWDWNGYEGKKIQVEAYCDGQEAELFLNGDSLGRKPVGNGEHQYFCLWDICYQPGTLEVVSYLEGREVGRYSLQTSGSPRLTAQADREALKAGSDQLCFVTVELRDQQGVLCQDSDRTVTLSLEGPAVLQGSGSADPQTLENYRDPVHRTYHGRLLAVLRAGDAPGLAKLTLTSPGMEPLAVEIPVKG